MLFTLVGAGWFLEKVTVKDSEAAAAEWVFPAHRWLDDHVGDCKTVRKLKLLGQFPVSRDNGDQDISRSSPNQGKLLFYKV